MYTSNPIAPAGPITIAGYRDRFLAAANRLLQGSTIPQDLRTFLDMASSAPLPQGANQYSFLMPCTVDTRMELIS